MYKALLVDDREVFLLELKRLPVWGAASGFGVNGEARNGHQALEMLRKDRYDVVLTDIRMPMMDGIQLLQAIHEESLCPCVVLISEYSEFEYARKGLVLGAFDYLVKPVELGSISDMLLRVGQYLGQIQSGEAPQGEEGGGDAHAYPVAEQKLIMDCIGTQNSRLCDLFEKAAYGTLHTQKDNAQRAGATVRRLYLNIINTLFSHYSWLTLYTSMDRYVIERVSTAQDAALLEYKAKLEELIAFINRLYPVDLSGNLQEICWYILENPEGEINLSAISNRYFINRTYLSNTFGQRTGMKYNDFITTVRMARAAFLLTHSDMKIYEISRLLGYQDVDYFKRIYKKYSGKTPTDWRKAMSSKPAGT